MPTATTTFLFDEPCSEIAAHILERASKAEAIDIVTGFATLDGLKKIIQPIEKDPQKLRSIVIGKATTRACDALDYLDKIKVPKDRLKIHLGFSKFDKYRNLINTKYIPMIHSKIFYLELPDGSASAFIGSHNITAFAMNGANGEAGVLIEGDKDNKNLLKVKKHIISINRQSTIYNSTKKELYVQLTRNYIQGFEAAMFPEDSEDKRTVLIFATSPNCELKINDRISVILDKTSFPNIGGAQVHLYLFNELPESPEKAFDSKKSAFKSFVGKIGDINSDESVGSLDIDYSIKYIESPQIIKKENIIYTYNPNNETRCIFKLSGNLENDIEYCFTPKKADLIAVLGNPTPYTWQPISDVVTTSNYENRKVFPETTEYILISYIEKSKKPLRPFRRSLFPALDGEDI
jgi:hypothetical protein